MLNLPKNVWILTACLALFMSLSVFMLFVGGIIGDVKGCVFGAAAGGKDIDGESSASIGSYRAGWT